MCINVTEDPFHQEVYHNNNYRIYEVKMKPYEETEVHQHFKNTLYICIDDVKFIEQVHNEDGTTKEGLIDVPAESVVPRPYDVTKTVHKGLNQEKEMFILGVESLEKYDDNDSSIKDFPVEIDNDYFNVYKLNG